MILCAALKYNDIIIPCCRHANGYEMLHDLKIKVKYEDVEEGFIDTQNNFFTRTEAFDETIRIGQLSAVTRQAKKDCLETALYSEDLY